MSKMNKIIFLLSIGFIPKRQGDLITWLENLKLKVGEHGATLGLTVDEIT